MALTKAKFGVISSALASGNATDGYVLTADGSGNSAWEEVAGGPTNKTFGTSSIMIGDNATGTIDAADYNTGLGIDIFAALTSGDRNTAIGFNCLNDVTTGSQNSFVGSYSGDQITTGNYNSGVGDGALGNNTTGSNNSGFGRRALFKNTTASNNTAVGYGALEENTTGVSHTAVGHQALDACTTGNNNTAFGKDALGALTTGGHNVACGLNALVAQTTSSNCTAMGSGAGFALTTSDKSTLIGREAGVAVTTGSSNTCIGGSAGYNITTGSENTMLGTNTHASAADGNNQICIGYNVSGVGNNYITMGSSTGSDRIYVKYDVNASWTRVSDERYKEEIQNNTDCGLDFINDLRPVTFKWKPKADIDNTLPDYDENKTERHHDGKMYGLIAQEVKQALEDNNITDFGGWTETPEGIQGISQEMFVHPLIKAVQELSAKCDSLQQEINTLKGV